VTFSPDGRHIASGSMAEKGQPAELCIWDAATGKQVRVRPLDQHQQVSQIDYSADGKRLVLAASESFIICEATTGAEVLRVPVGAGWVNCAVFSPDGKRLATAGFGGMVRIWHAETGRPLLTLHAHREQIHSLAFRPDGFQLASAGDDGTIKVWNVDDTSMKQGEQLRTYRGHRDVVRAVSFSPDGKRLASASNDATVRVWDADADQDKRILPVETGLVSGLDFSPDGRTLALASQDRTVRICDAETGLLLRILRGHASEVTSVAYSPDGRLLASAGAEDVRVWDTTSGRELFTLAGLKWIPVLAFSRDSRRLLTSSRSGNSTEIKCWDGATGKEIFVCRGWGPRPGVQSRRPALRLGQRRPHYQALGRSHRP
jgi:WD40 repeat protein